VSSSHLPEPLLPFPSAYPTFIPHSQLGVLQRLPLVMSYISESRFPSGRPHVVDKGWSYDKQESLAWRWRHEGDWGFRERCSRVTVNDSLNAILGVCASSVPCSELGRRLAPWIHPAATGRPGQFPWGVWFWFKCRTSWMHGGLMTWASPLISCHLVLCVSICSCKVGDNNTTIL
jgi:hypothetical protein